MAVAMLLRGGMWWGDRYGKKEEVEEDNNGVSVAASGGVDRLNGGFDEPSTTPTQRREAR
jgi:hypothetical protein